MLKKINISANFLKLLALISMFIDHIGVFLENNQLTYTKIAILLRIIGRISFPIYAFFIVEGFLHTKNLKKYISRLFILAIISEIPFDLFISNKLIYLSHQNTIFTYVLSLIMLYNLKKYEFNKYGYFIITALFALISYLLKTDYSYIGIVTISILYEYRKNKLESFVLSSITLLSQFPAMISFILLYFYDKKIGKYNIKYLFYIIYPLHFLILYFIKDYIIL